LLCDPSRLALNAHGFTLSGGRCLAACSGSRSAAARGETVENACVIRILLADRQEIFRDGLKRLLESEPNFVVVGGAGSARETLQLVQDLDPDVLLLDLALNGGDSLQILRTLAAIAHRVRTIGLTAGIDSGLLNAALQHGARGSIRKESATALLVQNIRTVFHDQHWICRDETGAALDETSGPGPADDAAKAKRYRLTRREMDIVSAVAAGESNKGIARKLSLSEDTVKHHVSHVFDKLGVFSRLELALFAFNHDLVKDFIDFLG
jgi:two-component system, NarL family, nitrate/nitrite response regulator NarL